jgi:hypothetical protein
MTDLTIPDSRTTGKRAWVTEITGRHAEYGLNRCFPRTFRAADLIHVTLQDGKIYEVCCPDQRQRYLLAVRETGPIKMDWRSVYDRASDMDRAASKRCVQEYVSRIDP